jgi:endonuclease/exonuclease/phosphatase family metal-dependent hydrolase
MDLDIYAIQEIADTTAFRSLLAGLPGYDGLYSEDAYAGGDYQKTAVVYRRGTVSVSHVRQLFWGEVVRPLLEMDAVAAHNGRTFDFRLMVMHLKAGGSGGDREQRLEACRLLKEYIDSELEAGGDSDFVVVGDWNDELDDPPDENVFQEFLDDSLDYRFLTLPLAGNSNYASYIGGGLIDHLMVTRSALDEYGGGTTATLRLDDVIPNYEAVISDHRPVLAMFQVFGLGR